MADRNLAKTLSGAKFTPNEVNKLISGAKYIYGRTNQSKIKIPFTPNYGNYKDDYITLADLKSMYTRLNNFIKLNKKNPAYVGVIAPNNSTGSTSGTTSPSDKKGKIQLAFEAKMGNVKTATEAINKIRSLGYDYYKNTYRNSGTGSLFKNIGRLKKYAMNCVDYTNILANLCIEMGYQVQIIQIKCQSATHLLFKIKGKEFKNWAWIDPAPMASTTSGVCAIGKVCWCTNPYGKGVEIVATNPKWYFNMFLDDLLK